MRTAQEDLVSAAVARSWHGRLRSAIALYAPALTWLAARSAGRSAWRREGQCLIWAAGCRPGASQGSQMVARARASAAAPASLLAAGPHAHIFSTSTRAARATMAATFITPTATRTTISPQQQPRQ